MASGKRSLVEKIGLEYLSDVTLAAYNVPRYGFLGKTNEELIKFFQSKYTVNQLYRILQSRLESKSASITAELLREKNGKELARKFIRRLPESAYPRLEFRLGHRICDLAFIDKEGDINAIEIKSNGDKIQVAKEQTRDYTQWADKVWLMVEDKRLEEAKNLGLDKGIGLISYKENNKSQPFEVVTEPSRVNHSLEEYLELLTFKALKIVAKIIGVKQAGTREDLRKNILNALNKCPNTLMQDSIDLVVKREILLPR